MRKICVSNPLRLGHFGDTTRIIEIFSRLPRECNAQVYAFYEENSKRLSDTGNFKIIRLKSTFFGKRIRYVSRVLSELLAICHGICMSNLDIVYQIQTTFSLSGLLISKIKKVPLIYEVNSLLEYEKEKSFLNNIIIKIAKFSEKQTVKHASKITVVTPGLKKIFHEEYRIPLQKIEVIPNGADIDLFYPVDKLKCRKELNLAQNKFIVCFVGGLGMGCGAKNIVEAAPYILKQVPNTLFLIVGDGPYRAIMEEKIKSLSLQDKFIFTGAKYHEVVPKYINASDVCIALYEIDERVKKIGLSPVKMYEYMACAKPVIGTNELKGMEILQKYNSGILVEQDDIIDISKSITYLLGNETIMEVIGKNGRQLVEDKYNWDAIAKQVARICDEEIKNGK